MGVMQSKMTRKRVTREQVIQSWIGFVVVSIIFGGIFSWWLFPGTWISWFIPAMVFVGAISTTLTYVSQGQIRCPHCGAELRDRALHCPTCGREILSQCPKCAGNVTWGERFCKNCGENLVGSQGPITQPTEQTQLGEVASIQAPVTVPVVTPPSPGAPERRFCSLCGEPMNPGAKYCFRCGTQLE
jgi:predicted amidophosphoribosyltransferase